MKIFIFGAGKVGRALARAFKTHGHTVTLRPARKGTPRARIDADLVLLSVRDKDLAPLAEELAQRGLVSRKAVVVHNAGALSADVLAPLAEVTAGVAQMHPMISFASRTFFPTLTRGNAHVKGDATAERKVRALAKQIGMTPRTFAKLDTVGYHAAAGLVANGAAALSAIGVELLTVAGVPRAEAPKLLGPLLRSVADNVEALGFPDALTGPVRRGDAGSIQRQLDLLQARVPGALPLFITSALAQIPLARALGEAPASSFDAMERVLKATPVGAAVGNASAKSSKSPRKSAPKRTTKPRP